MGDNRAISDDSRSHMFSAFPEHGTIPENEVAGRAFLIIWPPSQFGDLPIPATFQQAALHAGTAGATMLQVGGAAVTDDAGADVGHLRSFGELVDDEGVEMLVVGHGDVEQEVLAAGDDEHADGVGQAGCPVAESLDVAP
jgi:hypothetical protein